MQEPLVHESLKTGEHFDLHIDPVSDNFNISARTEIIQSD